MVKKKKHSHTLALTLLTTGILIITATVMAGHLLGKEYSGPQTMIYIPAKATEAQISDSLSAKAGTAGRYAATLLRWRDISPSRMHGAYMLRPGMDALDIFRMVSRNHQTPVRLTFNNLRTLDQLAGRVASTLDMSQEQFLSATDSILADTPEPQRIGHFIPDSYEFYWTASPQRVVSTLTSHYDRFWNEKRTSQASALGLTPIQVVTVASIAEEETNNNNERGTVGRLYINRLKRGMPLQADPTVKFAVGDFSLRRITARHLATQSPYNTYLNPGLPPGPIRMPSAATIDAILNAPANNYLYMCAKEDFSGLHNFTSDYSTHLANAARYHRALNARAIH